LIRAESAYPNKANEGDQKEMKKPIQMETTHIEKNDKNPLNLKPGQSVLVERTIRSIRYLETMHELVFYFGDDDRPHFMHRGERPWCRLYDGDRVLVLIKAFTRENIPKYMVWVGYRVGVSIHEYDWWGPNLPDGSIYLYVMDLEKIR
jgi:hypothetical protein